MSSIYTVLLFILPISIFAQNSDFRNPQNGTRYSFGVEKIRSASIASGDIDADGDIGDALVFFLDTREQAHTFVEKIRGAGLGTKNLPDAIRWHFAKHWEHLLLDNGSKDLDWNSRWATSSNLLERAVALPIMVKSSKDDLCQIAEKVIRISKDI